MTLSWEKYGDLAQKYADATVTLMAIEQITPPDQSTLPSVTPGDTRADTSLGKQPPDAKPPAQSKPGDTTPQTKPGETTPPAQTKPGDTTPQTKPGETTPPAQTKPGDTTQTKPGETTPPAQTKPGSTTPPAQTKPGEKTPAAQAAPGDTIAAGASTTTTTVVKDESKTVTTTSVSLEVALVVQRIVSDYLSSAAQNTCIRVFSTAPTPQTIPSAKDDPVGFEMMRNNLETLKGYCTNFFEILAGKAPASNKPPVPQPKQE